MTDPSAHRAFEAQVVDRLREELEVDIETRRGENLGPRRTTIWIVAVDDAVFVRSVRGNDGRWFRDLRVEPHCAIHVGSSRIPARAEPVDDATTLGQVSDELTRKYPDVAADLDPMLTPDAVAATLRLVPA